MLTCVNEIYLLRHQYVETFETRVTTNDGECHVEEVLSVFQHDYVDAFRVRVTNLFDARCDRSQLVFFSKFTMFRRI